MVNTKSKGTLLERQYKEYFTKLGYLVIRAAGSFQTDLVAIKKDVKPLLINVKWKRVYCGPQERKELIDDSIRVGGLAVLAYKHIPKGMKNSKPKLEILKDFKIQGDSLSPEFSKDPTETEYQFFLDA